MSAVDPRIDAYIAQAQPFAQPILTHLRAAIHAACADAEESIKWGRPAFLHKGRVFAVLGAFKAHAAMTLWRMGEHTGREEEAQGQFGKLTRIADLPDAAELTRLIGATLAAIEQPTAPKPRKAPRPELPEPAELTAALADAPAAKATWDGFAPSHRRDYNEWIGEAKRAETRAARVAQAIAWLAEGKNRNWKYQR